MPTTPLGIPTPSDSDPVSQMYSSQRAGFNKVDEILGGGLTPEIIQSVTEAAVETVKAVAQDADFISGDDSRAARLAYAADEWNVIFPDNDGRLSGGIRPDGAWEFFDVRAGHPDMPRAGITMMGDSLVQSHNLCESLATATGVPVRNLGRNGDTIDGIALNAGTMLTRWNVPGGTINGTGTTTVVPRRTLSLPADVKNWHGELGGVDGMIQTNDGGATFWFTRTVAGTSLAVSGAQLFRPAQADVRNDANGILAGRNDVSKGGTTLEGDQADHVIFKTIRMVEHVQSAHGQFFLLGTINRTTEPSGSAGYDQVVKICDALKTLYPGRFLDLRQYIVHQAIVDLGITPTSEDLANIANDCPPPSVMVDITHPTDAAMAAASNNLIAPYLLAQELI